MFTADIQASFASFAKLLLDFKGQICHLLEFYENFDQDFASCDESHNGRNSKLMLHYVGDKVKAYLLLKITCIDPWPGGISDLQLLHLEKVNNGAHFLAIPPRSPYFMPPVTA